MAAKKSFFVEKNPDFWRKVLQSYDKTLLLKAKTKPKPQAQKELLALDKWYQDDFPGIVQGRKKKNITKEELEKLMKWKLSRGKFRPMLPGLVASNSDAAVEQASTKAFSSLPNLSKAIKELSVLRGVGPATASAVLAAGAPDEAPFMADESVLAIPSISVIKYDLNCYLEFAENVKAASKTLQEKDPDYDWTPHKVELTLWTYVMCEKLDPDHLKKLTKENGSDEKSETSGRKRKSGDDNNNEAPTDTKKSKQKKTRSK